MKVKAMHTTQPQLHGRGCVAIRMPPGYSPKLSLFCQKATLASSLHLPAHPHSQTATNKLSKYF